MELEAKLQAEREQLEKKGKVKADQEMKEEEKISSGSDSHAALATGTETEGTEDDIKQQINNLEILEGKSKGRDQGREYVSAISPRQT